MLRTLVASGADTEVHYAAAAPERMAYRDDVVQLAGDRALCYTGGRSSETGMVCGVCSGDSPIRVEVARSGMTTDVPADTTILDAMLEAGVWTSYECRRGECGSCTATVRRGRAGPQGRVPDRGRPRAIHVPPRFESEGRTPGARSLTAARVDSTRGRQNS